MAPTSGAAQETEPDPARYIRLQVTITGGASSVVTFWAKAVTRDA
jgi:hypothetical protein